MHWIKVNFIGGETGSTELALFILLVYMAACGGVMLAGVFLDYDTTNAVDYLKFALPIVAAYVSAAFLGKNIFGSRVS